MAGGAALPRWEGEPDRGFGPALFWLAGSLFLFGDSLRLRLLLASPMIAAYAFAVAAEMWRASPWDMKVVRIVVVLLAVHGGFNVARFLAALAVPYSRLEASVVKPLNPVSLLEALILAIVLAFLLLSVAKEQVMNCYRRAALVDPLTGVSNRRGFDAEVRRMLARACRDGSFTALLLLDLDHFKAVNDEWGHMAGDRALRAFTDTVAAALRGGDLLGRIGGEEFAVALADCGTNQAFDLAERIRSAVASRPIRDGGNEICLTASIGVASVSGVELPDELMRTADAALYRAKAAGRDRVEKAPDPPALTVLSGVRDTAATPRVA